MRRIILALLLVAIICIPPILKAKDSPIFGKGVAYLLIGDKELATAHWETFFDDFPDPSLRGVFMGLIQKKDLWEVTKQFKRYLDNHHRSTIALVGIALSTSGMKLSTSIENLDRAIRLDPRYSSAYLCMGAEYVKKRNYPRAKLYFNKALSILRVPEYKILLAQIYLKENQPAEVVKLLKNEADKYADNFYFNYFTAEAYLHLGQLKQMDKYIHTALEIKPDSIRARILQARYLIEINELQNALTVLKTIKIEEFDKDYYKTYARVLLRLKDQKCKGYLDEIYIRNNWDKDVNRLLGLYYSFRKQEKGNIQNWINRALLSGNSVEQLKSQFSSSFNYPEYNYLNFFDIHKILWLSGEKLVVAAEKNSGDQGKLFFINADDLKITDVIGYKGRIQDMYLSKDKTKIIFSTIAVENQSVIAYAVEVSEKSARLRLISSKALPMPSIVVGFNYSSTLAYITDSRIGKLAFESPFSIVSQIGKKTPVYPSFPFPIYKYNFSTNRLSAVDINDMKTIARVPIRKVKKYSLINETQQSKSSIQNLIDKGKQMDLISSKFIKIFFAKDLSAFLIYLSDLENAFQALIYEHFSNRLYKVDETLFLGSGNYAEVTLKYLNPENKEILLMTKDDARRLIHFNYTTYLALELADEVIEMFYNPSRNLYYILTERSKKSVFTETNLEIVHMDPYVRDYVGLRRDLNKILYTREVLGNEEVYFSTFTGELLMMDGEYKFYYVGPSLQGTLNAISPCRKKTAAFINNRLVILDSLYSLRSKKQKKKEKDS